MGIAMTRFQEGSKDDWIFYTKMLLNGNKTNKIAGLFLKKCKIQVLQYAIILERDYHQWNFFFQLDLFCQYVNEIFSKVFLNKFKDP